VLVPRPETELLVEEALAFARIHACRLAIDVGTGSGCIAIAMAHELPELRIIAVDNSRSALDVASRNAVANGVAERITFVEGDMLDQVSAVADVIVSNPPYIPDADASELQRDVVQFEPHAALFGGIDGLDIIRRLFNEVPAHLAPEGRLIVEFGFGQDGQVRELATQTGWDAVRIREDLQGIPRTAVLARSRNGSGAGS
jgi:release factor glutamine methyltransferase